MSLIKLAILFATAAGTVATAFAFWWASLGGYEKAERWLEAVYEVKIYRAQQSRQPKLIIAGGSSSLFGVDSSLLSEQLGMEVVNMAGHASLSLSFHSDVIKRVARAGDIVVLPLEYEYYERPADSITDWQLANMQSWGHQHIKNSDVAEIVSFFRHASLVNAMERMTNSSRTTQESFADVIAQNEGAKGIAFPRWQSYNYSSLTFRGDFLPTLPPTQALSAEARKGIPYLKTSDVHPATLKGLHKLGRELERRGARLYITWPPSIKNGMFDLDDPYIRERANTLKRNLAVSGLQVICDPVEFNFDLGRFFDTSYHLNARGAVLRTMHLGNCLMNELFGGSQGHVDGPAIADEVYKKKLDAPNPHTGIRLRDLSELRAALNEYYKDHGRYPASEKWDGLFSPWGKSADEWIAGLVPKYIQVLPRDPRRNRDGQEQYLYRSNGVDYKVIAHGNPNDCQQVLRQAPSLVDPVRKCSAYGYWSPGAESW